MVEIFQTKFVEKIKTHFLLNKLFLFFENRDFYDNVEVHGTARQITDDSII